MKINMIKVNQIKKELEYNYGIGNKQSKLICNQLGISSNLKNNKTTKYEKIQISEYIRKRVKILNNPSLELSNNLDKVNNSPIGLNLKYIVKKNITNLISINCYRGVRHKKGYPVRGQRTRSNRRTVKRLYRKH